MAAGNNEDVAHGLSVLLEGELDAGDVVSCEKTLGWLGQVVSELRLTGYQAVHLRARNTGIAHRTLR